MSCLPNGSLRVSVARVPTRVGPSVSTRVLTIWSSHSPCRLRSSRYAKTSSGLRLISMRSTTGAIELSFLRLSANLTDRRARPVARDQVHAVTARDTAIAARELDDRASVPGPAVGSRLRRLRPVGLARHDARYTATSRNEERERHLALRRPLREERLPVRREVGLRPVAGLRAGRLADGERLAVTDEAVAADRIVERKIGSNAVALLDARDRARRR